MTFTINAFYLFIESIFGMALGYVFWLIVSITLGSAITGESSSLTTLATIIATLSTLGISTGVQRYLGRAHAEGSRDSFRSISQLFMKLTFLMIIISSIAIFIFGDFLSSIFDVSKGMIGLVIATSIFYSLVVALRTIVITSFNSKKLIVILLISTVARFGMLIPIFIFNLGAEGVAFSLTLYYIVSAGLLLLSTRENIFRRNTADKTFRTKELIVASIPSWLPNVISMIGTQSGLLFIFGVIGAEHAGVYFVAFSIFTAASALPTTIMSLAFPVMSGMKNDQEKLIGQVLRIGLFVIMPVVVAIATYSSFFMNAFGQDYAEGGTVLAILMLSLVPVELNRAVSTLSYAYGKYTQVLMLGIIPSIARIISYIFLVPSYGSDGAALAFLIGSIVGIAIAAYISLKNRYQFPVRNILIITFIPTLLGYGTFFIKEIHPVVGCIMIIIGAPILLARFRAVKYLEIEGVVHSIFTNQNRLRNQFLRIAKLIFIS